MLTIKHIDENGMETLVECHQFVREFRKDGYSQFLAYGEKPLPNDYIATWCGDENSTDKLRNSQTIYVMNRHGATVSIYSFKQPDFGEQPDPDRLAA